MTAVVITFVLALCLAFVISLAAKPKFVKKLTCSALFIAALGGLLIYGYGYSCTCDSAPLAIVRSTFATCGMLLGRNDYSGISAAPLMQYNISKVIFWLLHLMAMYATAGAAIVTVGVGLLQGIRIWLARRGDLLVIFGAGSGSLDFGKDMLSRPHTSVVFVEEKPASGLAEQIRTSGGLLRSDDGAVDATVRFMKSLGIRPGKRKIWLYALSGEHSKNIHYAHAFLKSLEALEVRSLQTSLVLLGMEEGMQTGFLAGDDHYGYGDLQIVDEAQMAARRLIHKYPPVKTLQFDENGRAAEDLDCMILGFGKVGQAVLQQLVMNGQFCGSTFHAVIFDPDYQKLTGRLLTQNKQLMENYDIRFSDSDARSSHMYEYLDSHQKTLNYIAICTGSDKTNEELACELLHHFICRGYSLPVYLCGYSGVTRMSTDGLPEKWDLYCRENLWQNGLDHMAMAVNQIYSQDNGRTMEENWALCDYFSRMSSRAFADFIPSVLHIAGKTEEDVLENGWKPEGALLENLSVAEHKRWCAFHYTMGYKAMDKETFHQRGQLHAKEREQTGKGKLRIGKDAAHRIHACLIPWEELDALSEAENTYTGGNVDYKAMDTNNILAMPQILRAAREGEESR